MAKSLMLRPRVPADSGKFTWHDAFVLRNALEQMAQGKSLERMSVQLAISRKLYLAREDAGLRTDNLDQEVEIELRNSEARILWKEIKKLSAESFGRDAMGRPVVVPLGPLSLMLADFADQLGETMPEPDDDGD